MNRRAKLKVPPSTQTSSPSKQSTLSKFFTVSKDTNNDKDNEEDNEKDNEKEEKKKPSPPKKVAKAPPVVKDEVRLHSHFCVRAPYYI